MPRLSRKVKQKARAAIRRSVRSDNPPDYSSVGRKTTIFPFATGSLVSFRKDWHSWDGDQCKKGVMGLVMKGPYTEYTDSRMQYVDAIVSGCMIENIPAKLLIIQENEED